MKSMPNHLSNITKGDNAKSKKGRVVIIVHNMSSCPTEQAARPYYVSRYQAWKHASHVTFYGGSCAGLARK